MRMADARVVRAVRCILQTAVGGVPLHEGTLRHARIVEHEVRPHEFHQLHSPLGEASEVVRLQFEAGGEGGDGGAGFGGWSAVWCPATH